MKKILGVLAVLVLSVAAFGQTTYGVIASGGTASGRINGRASLSGSSTVSLVIVNNTFPYEFETGAISFQTGPLANGSMQTGVTFGSGGTITVTTANEGQIFSGTFVAGTTWRPAFNGNDTHFYLLNGTAADAAGNTLVLSMTTTTDPSITCFFSGSETISSLNVGITIK
jgi:hypothetical protein